MEKRYLGEYTVDKIINEVGLYEKMYISLHNIQWRNNIPDQDNIDVQIFNEIAYGNKKVLSECVSCSEKRPFSNKIKFGGRPQFVTANGYFQSQIVDGMYSNEDEIIAEYLNNYFPNFSYINTTYLCTYDNAHSIYVAFCAFVEGDEICLIKIGQHPSMFEIQKKVIIQYKKILGKNYAELATALQLFSHGAGVGSFVYLRRIYENLIEEEHDTCKLKPDWSEDSYAKMRFGEKVKCLQDYGVDLIPIELIQYKEKIYGVLSAGIHSYNENECLDLFEILMTCIQLILDHKLEIINRRNKLQKITSKLNKTN